MGRLPITALTLVALCLVSQTARAQHLENDLQSLLGDMNVNNYANQVEGDDDFEVELFYRPDGETTDGKSGGNRPSPLPSPTARGSEGVRRLWGVADTETPIGRLFSYPIPADAFEGTVVRYQVKGLPTWLHWNSHLGVIEGVPRPADRGHHYITVKAVGKDGSTAKDVFAVDVVELSGSSLSRALGCRPKDDLSILSVVLDTHLPTVDAKSRVRLIRSASKFLGVKNLSLMSAPHDFDPLADDAAILAGPGSARIGTDGRRSESMSQLQWAVGCDGEVSKSQQAIVDHAEATSKNGELERSLNVPVIGWHVLQVNPSSKRVRRQADHSGDDYLTEYDDYNYDDYEYDYGEDGEGDYLSAYDEPETRVIPSLLTPVFPEASATYYPGNAGYNPERPVDYSPVLRPVPMSTPVYIPVKPTRIVEASPTITFDNGYPTEVYEIEGSMITHPSTTVESTTPLTYTTSSKKPVMPTKPIEATSVPTVEITETGIKNFPPRVKNRIKKLAWIAGHVYHLPIPRDTFEDMEDGDTSHLRLLFRTSDGLTVGRNSWIQFNPTRQEIYALPLEENIGRYTYILEAMDTEGRTTTDTVMIHVQQAKEARNFNHRFSATFKQEKKYEYEFVYSIDWQIKAVEKIAKAYGDTSMDNINVRSISEHPFKLTWTNTSLADSRSTHCPTDELEALAEVVVSGDGREITREVKEAFQPEFHLKHVHLHYLGPCERHTRPLPPGHGAREPPVNPINGKPEIFNTRPIIRNQIDYLNVTQGSLYRFQVPTDTCYDLEDGDSRRLHMRLLMATNLSPPPLDSWLQFDTANQEFFGIPLEADAGKKTEYLLECVDNDGEKITDALFVNVLEKQSKKLPPVEFSMKIDASYKEFMSDAHRKARLIKNIGDVFGDEDTSHIEIASLRRGSVAITWHNRTLPAEPCPNEDIMALRKVMVDDNGMLLPEFIDAFAPHFKVIGGSINPTGACLGENTPTVMKETTHHPPVEEPMEGEENDYLLNFIIPAIIIAAMLLLAAIIACCLYRRRRYGKMTMADDRTFVSKGIPIIFAEELDDRPDPAKSPVIMKDEKPPLPPPEYQRGSSPAASSTPPTSDRRRPTSGDVADDAPSYQPPPPFTATNGASRHPRPNMPPTYRKPPTYVPP